MYKVAADATNKYGKQTENQQVTAADLAALYEKSTNALWDAKTGGNAVAEKDLKNYFNEDGSLKEGKKLYATDGATRKEVGAEFMDQFVTVTPATDGTEETYQATKAL